MLTAHFRSAPGVLKFLMLSNNPAVLPSHLSEANTCRLPLPDHFKSFSHVNKDTLDTILLSKVVLRDNGHWSLTTVINQSYTIIADGMLPFCFQVLIGLAGRWQGGNDWRSPLQ